VNTDPTWPIFADAYRPGDGKEEAGLVGQIDIETARLRDRRGGPYVIAFRDRCLALNRGAGTMYFHSLMGNYQRGYLAHTFARKTRQWRLSHLYVQGAGDDYLFIEVPLWEGRARIVAAPFESPTEIPPPADTLRSFEPPTFGHWSSLEALPTDPHCWIDVPEYFPLA
jgi:hypothetical protein